MSQGEHELPWLGTARHWAAFGIVLFLGLLLCLTQWSSAGRSDAVVPIIALTGPEQVVAGSTARYAVLVRDRFGGPLAGADVRLGVFKAGFIELARAKSSESGDAAIELRVPDDFKESRSLVAIADAGIGEAYAELSIRPERPGQGAVFITTDKPLYQPGQVVHLRALVMTGETPLADRPSTVEIRTPDGIKVFRAEKPTSGFGIVAHDFALAEQVKLGNYSITFTTTTSENATVSASRSFEVKRYSLPKLKLAFEDLDEVVSPKAPVKGAVRASWIFGEPVTKGAVTVSLERAGSLVQRVKGQVDKNGKFDFEVIPTVGSYGTLVVRASLEVEGGMKAEATKTVSQVSAHQIALEALPESGVLIPEAPQDVFVIVTHPKPASVVLSVKGVPNSETKVNERGIAIMRVVPPKEKTLDIEATAPGGAFGRLQLTTTLDRLLLRPDKTQYEAGAAMKLAVLGAPPGDRVALRVTKGNEPLVTGMCTVAANGCEATLTLPPKASGLVWLHAMSLPSRDRPEGLRQVRGGHRLVVVRGGARDLALKVTADKQVYAPREIGNVDVAVTATGGAPMKAQLGVAVADEAVFALADVRPDLEKKFFTTDKDLATARRGGYWYAYSTPSAPSAGPHEATKVYDTSTTDDVRAAVLAALTKMPEPGGFAESTTESVAQKARAVVEDRRAKILGYAILFVAFMTMVLFGSFAAYGIARYREPRLLFEADADVAAKTPFVRETRGLMFDWLSSVIGPPVLVFASVVFGEVFFDSSGNERFLFGVWSAAALFAAIAVIRAIIRVRRLPETKETSTFRRALFLLPFATFLGHLVILLVINDRGRKFEHIVPLRQDTAFVPLAIVLAAQLTFGFLSVIRQGFLRPLAKKTRVWLLLSRASFIGLPVTLVIFCALAYTHVREVRRTSWEEYSQLDREGGYGNKQGGSGARAKGEEGSMGVAAPAAEPAPPPAQASNHRFGIKGPSDADDAEEKASAKPGGAAGRPIAVRDYFPETLMWAPEVFTDEAGKAKVQVPFADSITTWRFGLRAVSKTGQLGSATIPLVVKQDFFVEASLPPLLTQGDEIAVPVTVYGYTDQPQDVTVEIEGDGITTVGASSVSLRLERNETRGTRFVLRAEKAGDRIVRIKATSAARGDIVQRKLKIVPNGLEMTRPLNGRLQGGATVRTDFPAGAIDGGNDLYVKIYGGPLSQVAEGLDGVFVMPHGCFEQTSSVTYPSVLALDFLLRSKAASAEVEKKARAYIADGYQRLISFEVPGGGFSLFGAAPANGTLTAYGLMELSDMSRVAVVDEALLARTREWLYGKRTQTGGFKKNESDTADSPLATAYVTWALASFGTEKQAVDPRLASLLDWVENTNLPGADDAYGLALRSNALLAGARGDKARLLLDKLASLAKRGEDGVHWSSSESGVLYSYGASLEVEVTGLAAHALARANRDADLRAGALDWLVARKGSYGTWSTTQATIAAMRALLDEAKPAPKGPQQITVTVDGEKVDVYDMAPKARDVHHHVDLRKFSQSGSRAVVLEATGEGDVSYQLVTTHWIPWERPKPASLALDVTYGANAVSVGGTTKVRARISWNGKEPATMPLVEIGLPPAFEAEQSDLDAIVASKVGIDRWTLEHGKVTLYIATLPADKPLDVSFSVRATRAAKVVAPASSAYLYYHPEVRTETAPLLLRAL